MKKSITTLLLLVLCLLLCGTALAEDTPSVFYVLETDTFRATFGNLVFDGEDSCTYDVMIANLTEWEMELETPDYATLAPGETCIFEKYFWPIMETDRYGFDSILFEIYGFAEEEEVYGTYFLYYDRDARQVARKETAYGSAGAEKVFEIGNELVRMEGYYYDRTNIDIVVTNVSSYALYNHEGEMLAPGQSKTLYGYSDCKDEDTLVAYPTFYAYNAGRIPVLDTAYEVLLNRKDLSVISSTERENFIDLEQAKNTDVYRVNKFERVNAVVASTPYYTLTVKQIRAEEQPDGTILVTVTAEITNNTDSFYMLGTDVWKMGDEIRYASGYPGYLGAGSSKKIEYTYVVSNESDLSGTAAFTVEGGWDPKSMAVLFDGETHSVTVSWAGGKPSFN